MTSPGGFIHGNTDAMLQYGPQGPDPATLGTPAPLVCKIYGGPELMAADAGSTERLTAFVTAANAGFETLGQDARTAGQEYLSTEAAATAAFNDITQIPVYVG